MAPFIVFLDSRDEISGLFVCDSSHVVLTYNFWRTGRRLHVCVNSYLTQPVRDDSVSYTHIIWPSLYCIDRRGLPGCIKVIGQLETVGTLLASCMVTVSADYSDNASHTASLASTGTVYMF